ncbi:MAG: LPXTG cell wall anchor domain-containing protein, partial [Clostridiales bacterium]|nr:LPXTG cell wall anchor domain-containing protein [Clostridiales bacterium]
EGHTHTEDCYETVLTCTLEEHTHTVACMSDETADVETADDWEATLPELTGVWAADVVAVAESQLGYTESTANFTLGEDGETRRGYTRYGAWAGNEYGGWDAMFASFCLYYGGVSTEDFPESTGAYAWAVKLDECGLYAEAADCAPAPGDLAFFDTDGDGKADRVGIVTGVDTDSGDLTVIEGDCAADDGADAVAENTYAADDGTILGYGVLPEQETEEEAEEEPEANDAEDEEPDEEPSEEDDTTEEEPAEGNADEEGSDEEGSDEEGTDEEGTDEEGTDEEGADEEGTDEEGADEEGTDEVETETYTASADGVTVTVTAPVGALPEGAELFVALLDEDSDAYASAAEAIGYDGEDEDTGMAALDIAFHDGDGLEVEPSGAVTVSIDASALLPEDADAGTIEVQHLAEAEDGVETVLVADASEDTEGTVDTERVVAEFEVESFSTFTITWNGNVRLTVTVYVDGAEYTGSVSNVTLSSGSSIDLTTLLDSDEYTFSYATVVYNSGSTDAATAITYTTSGRNGTYTITTVGSTITNVNRISSVTVYYVSNTKDPSVSISAEETTIDYDLTATPSNFSGTDVTYTWTVDDTASASITGDGADAVLTWASGVSDGTEVNVTVTATYTYEDGGGNTVTETATDIYTVYYGVAEDVTFTVYYPTSSGTSAAASGVTVYVYDSNGTLVDSGTTNSSGQVTFELYDGVTYTVTTSNYTANNYTYSYSGSVTADATNGNVISLVRDTSSGKYEHIDIKQVTMTSTSSSLTLTDITSVVVYDSSGNEVYYTTDIETADTTSGEEQANNWHCIFASSGSTSGSHSISFDTSYTVVITYVASDGETYTATIDSSTTYPEGSYYPADGACAWQLYNYIYGTSYTESNWTSSSAYASVKDTGIDVSGMTYFEVAIVLCDSWGESRNGLDFALDIVSLLYLTAGWEPSVQKTYVNGSMASGNFTFNLYEADITEDGTTWTLNDALGSPVESVTNGAAAADASGDSQSTVSFSEINYSTSDAGTYYYIISETQGDDGFVTYDDTIYGVKVVVAVTPVTTSLGVVTSYETSITTTYYELTVITDGSGTVTGYTAKEVSLSSSDGAVPFTNVYSSGVELPSTGGPGLWMYILAGLTLCGGAGVLYFRRRRQH